MDSATLIRKLTTQLRQVTNLCTSLGGQLEAEKEKHQREKDEWLKKEKAYQDESGKQRRVIQALSKSVADYGATAILSEEVVALRTSVLEQSRNLQALFTAMREELESEEAKDHSSAL